VSKTIIRKTEIQWTQDGKDIFLTLGEVKPGETVVDVDVDFTTGYCNIHIEDLSDQEKILDRN